MLSTKPTTKRLQPKIKNQRSIQSKSTHSKSQRLKSTRKLTKSSLSTSQPLQILSSTSHNNNIQRPSSQLYTQQFASLSTFDLDIQYDPESVSIGPDPVAVRSVLRQLLRNTNPRIQGMKPRRTMHKSNAFRAILNEYRIKMNCSVQDAWKNHATAAQMVIALKANTYNANVLYQSGWKPARPQKQQIESVAKHMGMGLNENTDDLDAILNPDKLNLEDMLLFSNSKIRVDPKTDAQQILGDDTIFNDIFGGAADKMKMDDITDTLQNTKNAMKGIDAKLQQALFDDLGFGDSSNNDTTQAATTTTNNNNIDIDTQHILVDKIDTQGFPIKYNPSKYHQNGMNGWETTSESILTRTYKSILTDTTSDRITTFDSATTYATGQFTFTRAIISKVVSSMQYNEDVNSYGILGCLMNNVENISIPSIFPASYNGINGITQGEPIH